MDIHTVKITFIGSLHQRSAHSGSTQASHVGVRLHPNLIIHISTSGRLHSDHLNITFFLDDTKTPCSYSSSWLSKYSPILHQIDEGETSTCSKLPFMSEQELFPNAGRGIGYGLVIGGGSGWGRAYHGDVKMTVARDAVRIVEEDRKEDLKRWTRFSSCRCRIMAVEELRVLEDGIAKLVRLLLLKTCGLYRGDELEIRTDFPFDLRACSPTHPSITELGGSSLL